MRSLFFRGTFFFRLFDAKKKQKQQQQDASSLFLLFLLLEALSPPLPGCCWSDLRSLPETSFEPLSRGQQREEETGRCIKVVGAEVDAASSLFISFAFSPLKTELSRTRVRL